MILQNKSAKVTGIGEAIISLIVAILIVISIPELKEFFANLLGQVLAIILLAVFVGVVIFVVFKLIENSNSGSTY
jgi:4-amino-4-deoxy-L-arabinose transferase-like glycosyltransferase